MISSTRSIGIARSGRHDGGLTVQVPFADSTWQPSEVKIALDALSS